MKEETIKKKTKQGLAALGALAALGIGVLIFGGDGDDYTSVAGGLGLLGLYFLPIIIGVARKHPQIAPIAIINVLLGWTIIGWIGALVWSVASFKREVAAPAPPAPSGPAAP